MFLAWHLQGINGSASGWSLLDVVCRWAAAVVHRPIGITLAYATARGPEKLNDCRQACGELQNPHVPYAILTIVSTLHDGDASCAYCCQTIPSLLVPRQQFSRCLISMHTCILVKRVSNSTEPSSREAQQRVKPLQCREMQHAIGHQVQQHERRRHWGRTRSSMTALAKKRSFGVESDAPPACSCLLAALDHARSSHYRCIYCTIGLRQRRRQCDIIKRSSRAYRVMPTHPTRSLYLLRLQESTFPTGQTPRDRVYNT